MSSRWWKSYRQSSVRLSRTDRGRALRVEPLEPRVLLDGDGFLIGADVHFSLSFAPDGTDIAGQTSGLAAKFDAIAPTADWQAAILQAFQTWAVETNSDIGVVADNGDPFGSPGPIQKDSRFGDIRIGAIKMSPEVGAVSVPVDGLVSGTWFADVVFNTAFDYQTLDDILAVAMHEAGNVFGLEDNNDPTSPLFTGGPPTVNTPTANDIAALQQLHGTRMADFNESDDGVTGNDSFAKATQLKKVEIEGQPEGIAPSIVYGDITDNIDRDFYEIELPEDYSGTVTIQVRSSGISLLAPTVSLYDDTQLLLQQNVSTSKLGDMTVLQFQATEEDPFIEITGTEPGLLGIGGYSLVAIFDAINQVDQATIDSIAGGQFRFLEQEELSEFFDSDDDSLLGDDAHTDDDASSAAELETSVGFVESTRYELVGSIADVTDVDFYKVKSPKTAAIPLDVMTIILRSLDAGGLIPRVTVFEDGGQVVASTLLANGGGDYIIQVDGVTADDEYKLKIEADDSVGVFNTGNYNLVVAFGSQATQLDALSAGTVGDGTTQNVHTVYIGQPQLFHLALKVDPTATTAPTAIVATIKNELGETVYQIAARPGETRSREAVLLNPGTYTVNVVPLTLDGSVPPALSYTLLGTAISDPFVGDPDDPNSHPFACTEPDLEGFFCYPGDFVSPDPFLWDDFIDSLSGPPDGIDPSDTASFLFGDWWSWVWDQTGTNGPPFVTSDAIQVSAAASGLAALLLGPTGSVLDNDIDPENDALIALLQTGPINGSLNFAEDGTFVYTPNFGFRGRDEFTYTAFDFIQESNPATVTIIVGESGDFDADGDLDGADFLAWQRGFGTPSGAVLTNGDSDFDGDVDGQDLGTWQQQFGQSSEPVASHGDFDGDGDFDGSDFLAWQRGFGTTFGASATDGDANADGTVNSQDLAIWQGNFGTGAVAPTVEGGNEPIASAVSALTISTSSEQFVSESFLSANFFLEFRPHALNTAQSGHINSPFQPELIESLPSFASAQFSKPQTLVSTARELKTAHTREIAARDRIFSNIGLSQLQDIRSSLRDVFSEPDVSTRID